MYLREVEANPQPSPYADLIYTTKAANREYWQIWNLFAFRPEITSHLANFTEGVMRSPSSVDLGLRELIAAYTSWINECQFCWKSHAAVAAELLGSEELVRAVLDDLESAPLPEKEKALLRFAGKITKHLPEMGQHDVDALHAQGWADEAIYFTILVVSLFNFYNRWVTTSGVHPVSDEAHRTQGKRLHSAAMSRSTDFKGCRTLWPDINVASRLMHLRGRNAPGITRCCETTDGISFSACQMRASLQTSFWPANPNPQLVQSTVHFSIPDLGITGF